MKLNFVPFPTLVTDQLILRELELEDSPLIFNYRSNPDNYPYVKMVTYTEEKQAIDYIKKVNKGIQDNKWIIWAITLKNSNDIIGSISLWNLDLENNVAELGYGLYPGNHSTGYMTEALNKVCEYAYQEMDIRKLEAYTNEINTPARNLLKKCGFTTKSWTVEDNTKLTIYFKYRKEKNDSENVNIISEKE